MPVKTQSPTGHRLEPVDAREGESGHRIGSLDRCKADIGLGDQDAYTVCLMLDSSDERTELKDGTPTLPILFRFDCEWDGTLAYRVEPTGAVRILREPWGDTFDPREVYEGPDSADLWPPRGDLGVRLTPIPKELHDLFCQIHGSWYGAPQRLQDQYFEYVFVTVGYFFGPGYHQLGGVPGWVQDTVEPACPECESPMQFLLSLDSCPRLGWMIGDEGRLYAFLCEDCTCVTIEAQCT